MIPATETDLAYIAGIIDGEGCIMITERSRPPTRRCKTPSFIVSVAVSMTDKESVDFIGARFKGRIYQFKAMERKYKYYRFSASCKNEVTALLVAIQPYIKVKSVQVKLALKFCNSPSFTGGWGQEVPEEEVAVRRHIASEISYLNQGGLKLS